MSSTFPNNSYSPAGDRFDIMPDAADYVRSASILPMLTVQLIVLATGEQLQFARSRCRWALCPSVHLPVQRAKLELRQPYDAMRLHNPQRIKGSLNNVLAGERTISVASKLQAHAVSFAKRPGVHAPKTLMSRQRGHEATLRRRLRAT
ncbi:hypothetical protein NM688_g8580 [Phlebia brevispora]|uniref:Uncharacterized protein n=1 Tax=Phlebia brevispora TaxID=194682 RepID=A0ACC1RR75_9APHY|nr:hypothetical protein NM688_g8580 [Phlebia brevispora]